MTVRDSAVEGPYSHAAPAEQPNRVRDVAARLFPAYSVEGGTVHLAGCRLEDRWFIRAQSYHQGRQDTVFVDCQGRRVSPETASELGLWQLTSLPRPARRLDDRLIAEIDAAAAAARDACGELGEGAVSIAVVWCKWVEGKLRFTVNEATADLPFQGWARTLQAPAYVCPATGVKTYHMAAADDGQIDDGQIIANRRLLPHAESGRGAADSHLVTCSVTGLRVLPEHTRRCAVSGDVVLAEEMVVCRSCQQEVSPKLAHHRRCQACRQLHPVSKADPRMARVLDEHPKLDRFGHWRMTETAGAYVLDCRRWTKRLVLVVDKHSLELKSLSVGSRLLPRLRPVESSLFDAVLNG